MDGANILYVFADQLRYGGLEYNGDQAVQAPNVNRLARLIRGHQ